MYNIESLADLAGLSKRTIRYYIELGLLTPPIGSCRGSYYTDSHLNRLEQIKRLSSQGVPLTQMKAIMPNESTSILFSCEDDIKLSVWTRAFISENIELNFKQDILNKNELDKIKHFIIELLKNRDND